MFDGGDPQDDPANSCPRWYSSQTAGAPDRVALQLGHMRDKRKAFLVPVAAASAAVGFVLGRWVGLPMACFAWHVHQGLCCL